MFPNMVAIYQKYFLFRRSSSKTSFFPCLHAFLTISVAYLQKLRDAVPVLWHLQLRVYEIDPDLAHLRSRRLHLEDAAAHRVVAVREGRVDEVHEDVSAAVAAAVDARPDRLLLVVVVVAVRTSAVHHEAVVVAAVALSVRKIVTKGLFEGANASNKLF